ncbi:hypothetical protein TELCIR_13544 [Teladorsagia circumcincta]|uniref:glucuronosyltransferase n=1 Tax=Teladorsagia circumcincta TaxID=45464 RepID=A0A2G9U3K2_TELCI|nr:hypothetical protein TELCIR_13544 [Teladorsagia circumcincta]
MYYRKNETLLADPRLTVFVTHGGLGSTTELAHMGKPALLIPLFSDQTRNAHMLTKHGGGIVLKKSDLENPQMITDSLKSIISDDSYSQNAKRLAEMLLNQPISAKQLFIRHSEFAASGSSRNWFSFTNESISGDEMLLLANLNKC